MLYIDNLCQFIKLMIDNEEKGVFFPQNAEYTVTSEMVKMIADAKGHKIILIPGLGWLVKLMTKVPGKVGGLALKAFGNLTYDMTMSMYKDNYNVCSFNSSIEMSD